MAIQIDNGVLSNNDDAFVKYYVLNDEETQVYEVDEDSDKDIIISKVTDPENNPIIKDLSTEIDYYLAVNDDVLYIKNAAADALLTCKDGETICDKLDELIEDNNFLAVS